MARRLPFTLWGAVVLLAATCATPYQQHSLRGGYDDSRIDSNTVLVSFKGNGYTPKDRVQTYMLYRCAEVTANAGYDYFVIISGDDEVKEGAINLPGSYSSTTTASVWGFGNSAVGSAYTHGTYYPSQSIPYHKHTVQALIKMYKGDKPANNPAAFNAKDVLTFLGPKVTGTPVAQTPALEQGGPSQP